jgi:pyruvate formate lyase activating enzyme
MSVDELMRVLNRDRQYWRGDGGVTFSGGEPLGQKAFIRETLKRCHDAHIHTAVETTACVAPEHFFEALRFVDWAFIDIKHMDPDKHRSFTGVDNGLILSNIATLAGADWPGMLLVRIPVIEGFNDDEDNIRARADFLAQNGLEEVNLLPFHRLGDSKWQQLGMEYPYRDCGATAQGKMDSLAAIFEARGVKCYLGALTPF